ncbi:MAG: hypothetical protein JWL69_5122 [Phycisphaerales bacterium]|nr:hypothetical protein [Phycisphaerales bacterium]
MQDQRRINDEDLDGGERELRDALASLRPARPAIDVTAIAVAAARAAERRRLWFWRMATGALAACLALVLLLHRAERPVDRLVIGTGNPAPHPTDIAPILAARHENVPLAADPFSTPARINEAEASEDSYLATRQRVLRRGLSGLIPPLSLVKDAGRVTTSAPELTPLAGPTLQTGTAGPIPRLLKLIEKGA